MSSTNEDNEDLEKSDTKSESSKLFHSDFGSTWPFKTRRRSSNDSRLMLLGGDEVKTTLVLNVNQGGQNQPTKNGGTMMQPYLKVSKKVQYFIKGQWMIFYCWMLQMGFYNVAHLVLTLHNPLVKVT